MKFSSLRSHYKNVHIITHNDLDGYGCGEVLINLLKNTLGFSEESILITYTDYSNPLPFYDDDEFVIISDISISNKEDAQKIINFNSMPNSLVFWIDHHQSSINLYPFYPKLKDIYGIRNTDACGTLLCWIMEQFITLVYANNACEESIATINTRLNTCNVYDIANSDNEPVMIWNNHYSVIPESIRLVDDYDRFRLKYNDSIYLNAAFYLYPDFSKYFMKMNNGTTKLIKIGKKIYYWRKIIYLNELKEHGFIASLPIEGMQDIDMICLNSGYRSSLLFGNSFGVSDDNHRRYNYGCIFNCSGNKTTVSIYCANPEVVSESKRRIGKIYSAIDICKRYNGGGHPGAAGFVIKDGMIDFCQIRSIPSAVIDTINNDIAECYQILNEGAQNDSIYRWFI